MKVGTRPPAELLPRRHNRLWQAVLQTGTLGAGRAQGNVQTASRSGLRCSLCRSRNSRSILGHMPASSSLWYRAPKADGGSTRDGGNQAERRALLWSPASWLPELLRGQRRQTRMSVCRHGIVVAGAIVEKTRLPKKIAAAKLAMLWRVRPGQLEGSADAAPHPRQRIQ